MIMEASRFQFSQPRLLKLSYQENQNFVSENETVEIAVEVRPTIHYTEGETDAVVELQLNLGDQLEAPFSISIVMEAAFHWEEGGFSEELVQKLLRKNAVSLLLSYSRPIIATVTSQSSFPAYNLPYVDLTNG